MGCGFSWERGKERKREVEETGWVLWEKLEEHTKEFKSKVKNSISGSRRSRCGIPRSELREGTGRLSILGGLWTVEIVDDRVEMSI